MKAFVIPKSEEFINGIDQQITDIVNGSDKVIDWRKCLLTEKPVDIIPLLVFLTVPIWTQKNHSLIISLILKYE